jgi:UDP-3-O-[3-hydroxymyristoyl] glucosamine N-acyltransferase
MGLTENRVVRINTLLRRADFLLNQLQANMMIHASEAMTADDSANGYAHALTVGELAERIQGAVEGDHGALIVGVSSIDEAEFGDVVFAENARFLSKAAKSRASAIVSFLDAATPDKPLIKVDNPRYAFAKILELFRQPLNVEPGVHPTAVMGRGAHLGENASIGPHCTVGDNVRIGARSVFMPGCHVGDDCEIGEDCIVFPNVTLYPFTKLGARVTIHSGTVVGADGFGYMRIGDHSYKVPHVGNVEIDDDVEIGANCAIDRAKTGSTIIGARTKIDNLVHVAHNVKIGTDCIIIAQVGVAGSVELGHGVTLAGQVGLKDHIKIGDGAIVMAQGGVFGDVKAGEQVSGYPARPHREKMRVEAATAKLPEYVRRIRALEKQNADMAKLLQAMAEKLGMDGGQATEGTKPAEAEEAQATAG